LRELERSNLSPLAVTAAWVAGLAGEGERAARFGEAARRGSWDGAMPDGSASLESALAIMPQTSGLSDMRTAAQRAVELEPATSPWRAIALERLGVAEALDGQFANARLALTEAVRLTGGDNSTAAFSLAYLALISLYEGDEEEAFQIAQRSHAIADRPGMRTFMPSIATYSVVANLLSRRGDLEETARAVDRANELLPKVSEVSWWQMIMTRILLAPALASLGRGNEAARLLDEAGAVLAMHTDAGRLPEWHAETARELRLAGRRPQPSEELSDAERRILRMLASDLTLREIGRELYVSLNTVRTHVHSIYRKLGVSSRADAVRVARAQPPAMSSESPG
jgi:LuxR family transcriptional regulator, maltose regulon positive regulatory protein